VSWTFFNPRAGVRFDPSATVGVYASAGRMSREPARSDMLNGEDDATLPYDLGAVEPERLWDYEGGVELRRGRFTGNANVYAMEFDNEIALSGELSAIGLPVRTNAGRSHRRGLELDVAYAPSARLRLTANASFSRNRIESWTQYYDVYDAAGEWVDRVPRVHPDVRPLLTPEAILNAAVEWSPSRDARLAVAGRWVGRAQLDNTGNAEFRTPSFFGLDASLSVSFARWVSRGEPRLRLQATNLLNDDRMWPGGYSYLFLSRGDGGADTLGGSAYYYPLATRSVFVTLDVRF
jgi:iron complex outermembrane receptor protein